MDGGAGEPIPGALYLDQMFRDNLANLTSGLGGPKDKATHATFASRAPLTRDSINALYYRNWLGAKVIDIPAEDMCREWRQWVGTKRDIEALEEMERTLRVREHVMLAKKWAAKDGGSAILIGTGEDPVTELLPTSVRKGTVTFLHVVSCHELGTGTLNLNPSLPYFGQPTYYTLPVDNQRQIVIHPSRVIPFIGVPRDGGFGRGDVWGDSVFERLHDVIRDATASMQAGASMIQEAKVDVIQIPGLTANINRPEYAAAVIARFGLAMTLKSLNNTLLLDAEEHWEQKTLTFQGLPEMQEKSLTVVAGAADMPVTRLLGRSPAGLNATGKADLEAYYTMVRSRQESELRPRLERLDNVLIPSALGRRPRGLTFQWRSLWSLPATDRAEVDHKRAQAVQALAATGLFDPLALRTAVVNQAEEDDFLPGLAAAVALNPGIPANEPPPAPAAPPRIGGPRPAARPAPANDGETAEE